MNAPPTMLARFNPIALLRRTQPPLLRWAAIATLGLALVGSALTWFGLPIRAHVTVENALASLHVPRMVAFSIAAGLTRSSFLCITWPTVAATTVALFAGRSTRPVGLAITFLLTWMMLRNALIGTFFHLSPSTLGSLQNSAPSRVLFFTADATLDAVVLALLLRARWIVPMWAIGALTVACLLTVMNAGPGITQVAWWLLICWQPIVCTAIVWWALARRPQHIDPSRCATCGYDLRATASAVCPECGAMRPVAMDVGDCAQAKSG